MNLSFSFVARRPRLQIWFLGSSPFFSQFERVEIIVNTHKKMELYFQVTFSFLSPVTPTKTLLENKSSTQREKRISIYGDESEFVTCLLSLSKETCKFTNFLSREKECS